MSRKVLLLLVAIVATVLVAAVVLRPASMDCGEPLTRDDLDQGIRLASKYLVTAQRPDGDFVYQVDWRTGAEQRENNAVRQAGATWGLGLLWEDTHDPAVGAALDRSLDKWNALARTDAGGNRWVTYGGSDRGQLGAVALVALAHAARLRAGDDLDDARRAELRAALEGYVAFVLAARRKEGGFSDDYHAVTGAVGGSSNPYADGEALLLTVEAARLLERDDWKALALAWAEEDHARNVAGPLSREPDPDTTKGYYQWGSMSWFQMADAGWEGADRFGERLVDLAVWMVDVHRTLERTRNTAYAYEGILTAWEWARRTGDPRADHLACTAHQGLRKLSSWQLGHPLAPDDLRAAPDRFQGGVQNERTEPFLRIDVTQHQSHALLLARRFGVDRARPGR